MGREKRNPPAAVVGGPKERHKRAQRPQYDHTAPVPLGFVAKPAVPKIKHHSYIEIVENKDKKKKLEFKATTDRTPPPGYEFIPIGNPQLTTACKELSRAKDAMVFIVSNPRDGACSNPMSLQVYRTGHHFREAIVEEARANLHDLPPSTRESALAEEPEPIPESQAEYNKQVDAALRDFFPKIPNTDRQMIIEHAFTRGAKRQVVGRAAELTLARRVHLAVLAHIRHTHTRYDELLRETSWQNARKVVEGLCLDILVKWRGDEESGRDQLDEILREVVIISDSEDGDSEEETEDSSSGERDVPKFSPRPTDRLPDTSMLPSLDPRPPHKPAPRRTGPLTPTRTKANTRKANRKRTAEKKLQRGFNRYRAAWEDAVRRQDDDEPQPQASAMDRTTSQRPYQHQAHLAAPGPLLDVRGYPADLGFDDPPRNLPPSPHGHLTRDPAGYHPPSLRSSPHLVPAPSFQPAYDEVNPYVHRRMAPVPHRLASPAVNTLKDMLLPSIEPPSPGATQPAFVRTLPPKRHLPVDHSPLRPSVHQRVRAASPSTDQTMRDEHGYFGRRVVSDRAPYGDAPTHGFSEGGNSRFSLPRDQNDLRTSGDRNQASSSTVHYPEAREPDLAYPAPPPAKRILVDAPRPGERSNPILMEDRGGFYERVPAREEGQPIPLDANIELRRPLRGFPRAPEHHRVVSWEEGSRILEESRGNAGVEIIPISSPRTLPPEARSHITSTQPFPVHHGQSNAPAFGAPNRFELRPPYEERHALEHRPVSDGEYMASQSRPFGEEQRRDDWPGAAEQKYQQPVYRHYRGEQPPVNHQYGENRPPRRHRQPENVIVLE